MAAPKTTPTKPSTPAAPPAASTSSWRDKFKDYFKSRDKSPPTQNTTDKTESKSVLSRIKDDTKDTVSKLVKLFVGSDEIDGFTKKTPPQKILKGIVKLLVEIETQKKLDYVNDRRTLKQEEREFNRRHKEILKALTVRRKPVKKKPTKKTEQAAQPTTPTTPPSGRTPTTTAPTGAKPSAAAPKTTPKAAEPTPAPKTTPKAAEPTPAPKATPKAAEPVTSQAPTPTATPAPISTPTALPTPPTPKTPIATAAKIAIGTTAVATAGISSAAALSIERETGKPASQAIKNVGQIVPNDPKAGVTSYGIFGINSQGSIQSFVKDNPQFELNDKPASKEFDEKWKKISNEKPQEMLNAQLNWYDNHVAKPLKKDLSVMVPKEFSDNAKIVTYFSDRRVQYGKTLEKEAISYASSAKTPEEFIRSVTEYDLAHLKDAFKTYLSTHPDAIKGLQKRLTERERVSLNATGVELAQKSTENKDMKTAMADQSSLNKTINNVSVTEKVASAGTTTQPVDDRSTFERSKG